MKARPGRKLPRYLRSDQGDRKPRPRQNTGTWTAVSTPPYFTALALWPAIGTWTGGGGFVSERTIFLYEGEDGLLPIAHVPLPRDMRVAPASAARLGTAPRRSAAAPLYAPNETYGRVLDEVHGRIWLALVESGLALLDWIHPKDGDLLFAGSGCVYRLERWREVAPEQYFARARVLADFSGDRFRLVTAPRSAMRW